ncbi:AcrR family transcriptional regulator [Allocatelliglobosispora scoriae]|uniref:AcrR family transcriptional regulator n=1 Tax=Allocatelliglobosispora scoriae TaxID=643052 RepID=A0A841BH54_9ACTN|nr:TetR/AcrR family transcriptional regulator [Allocatelliglobosispora scoriae]MBB5866965.1 AcrR family transcriptional regulator [Allocatelliglobosispora scoriae]
MTPSADDAVTLRADAERNRAKLLCAARSVFAEQGLEAPLEEIARRAGVGIATLYRRFPTRESLVVATSIERMAGYAEAAREALALPSAWEGFASYLRRWCELQVADRGLADVMTLRFPEDREFEARRTEAQAGFWALIERAQAEGTLRADFVPEDFIMIMMANTGIIHSGGDAAPQLSARLLGYLLQSFRAGAASGPLPPPVRPDEMNAAMCR